jgi:hypothetical protein
MVRINVFPDLFLQRENWWTGSTARGPGGAARVHGGPEEARTKGAMALRWCMACGRYGLSRLTSREDEEVAAKP